MKRKIIIPVMSIVLILALGLFLPLGTYTTTKGCPINPTPSERLSLMRGDSIAKIKSADVEPGPTEGCAANKKFTLYFF